MSALVRILSTSSVDSSPSILLVEPDGSKILVNCGEGCQRMFLEYSQRLSTVKIVCLTHLAPETIGGLPGMILTSADAAASATAERFVANSVKVGLDGKSGNKPTTSLPSFDQPDVLPRLDIVGPSGTNHFAHALRHFMRREKFQVKIHEGRVNGLRLSSASAKQGKANKKKNQDDDNDGSFFSVDSIVFHQESMDVSTKKRPYHDNNSQSTSPTKKVQRQIMSFIFKTPPIPGKFLVEKANEIGIPKGSLFGQLKAGKSVTFLDKNGTEKTVESHDVVTPATPSVAVMVLYYPCEEVAEQMFSAQSFQPYVEDCTLELVVHITLKHLFEQYGLNHWKKETNSSSIDHIFLSTDRHYGDNDRSPFQSAAVGATSRWLLNKDLYLIPKSSLPKATEENPRGGYREGRIMMEYNLVPRTKKGFQELAAQANIDIDDLKSLNENCGALELSVEILKGIDLDQTGATEGELIFTGTGSAVPCKHRNVTGMLLKQSDGRSILLDVGEGTIGQLLRIQPDFQANMLGNIKAVWISHPHADHHLGLLRLLHDRKARDAIMLIAPTPIFHFLDEYAEIDPSIRDSYDAVDCCHLIDYNAQIEHRLNRALGIGNCRAVPVQHCPHSFACILEQTDFGRLVYSGDCRPSNRLVDAAKGTDLLIHEATFENGMEAEAVLKRHSTVGEALNIAERIHAKCAVLTHFSQRYPKIQPLSTESHGAIPVVFAFDYMRLTPSTLAIASKFTPVVRLLYPETTESGATDTSSDAMAAMSVPGVFAQADLL